MMLFQTERQTLRILGFLVLHLFLIHFCGASVADSPPVITLAGIDKTTRGVVLSCESNNWDSTPEVLWLDGKGNLLSAGPTETVRGPDHLYTVSSRVTVEKRHSNRFTCRVQQKSINLIKDTEIYVTDDFFSFPLCSDATVIGLAVTLSLVFIMLTVTYAFFVWKLRKNTTKTKSQCDETEKGEEKNGSSERQQLMTEETVEMENLDQDKMGGKTDDTETSEQTGTDKQKKETENNIKNKLRDKQAEVDQLSEEEQRMKEELQTLNKELENKKQELQEISDELSSVFRLNPKKEAQKKKKKKEVEQEVETLKKKIKKKQAELKKLQDEKQRQESMQSPKAEKPNFNHEAHLFLGI